MGEWVGKHTHAHRGPRDEPNDEGTATAVGSSSLIDEIVREDGRRMRAEALRAEMEAYTAWFREEIDEQGGRLVVSNG